MRQCFRIMGMPDKVLAFDALPERLLKGFELCPADGFPRHWKEWLGKIKKETKIPPEKDFLTGQVRYYNPIVEEDSYFYLVDITLGPVMERWKEIGDFVRRTVSKEIRLTEKLEDMAKPLANNKTDGVTLEPEDVTIIPIPLEYQEKSDKLTIIGSTAGKEQNVPRATIETEKAESLIHCDEEGCDFTAKGAYGKASLRMHKKKHAKKVATEVESASIEADKVA